MTKWADVTVKSMSLVPPHCPPLSPLIFGSYCSERTTFSVIAGSHLHVVGPSVFPELKIHDNSLFLVRGVAV